MPGEVTTPVTLEIKNYRCFPETHPLRLDLTPGFKSFVGINNAGKSSILRFFWEFAGLFQHLGSPGGNLFNALSGNAQDVARPRSAAGEEVFSKLNTRDIELQFSWNARSVMEPDKVVPHRVTLTLQRPTAAYIAVIDVNGATLDLHDGLDYVNDSVIRRAGQPTVELNPLFEACAFIGGAMYLGPFRNTINVGGDEPYFDIQVGSQFTAQFHSYKAGGDPAANEAIYQLIQDIKRVFAFSELDINADPDRKTLQVFIDGRSFRLSELGTGMAQFILVLANVLVKRPTLVLIDEPEASLHPILQLDFLTTIASYTTESSVFFATHNLGLARAASDRVFSCRRIELGVSEVKSLEATPHLAEFLGELGFSAYRDLGFDSVLLVEGPSDVKTVQQLLRQLRKDHEVVLLPLGGSSMINAKAEAELAEVQRITPKVAVVIDSERVDTEAPLSGDRAAFVELCERFDIRTLVLERRAIENYLPDEAVKRALGDAHAGLGAFELLADASPGWSKRDNWKIAREMSEEDLADTDLGRFLREL